MHLFQNEGKPARQYVHIDIKDGDISPESIIRFAEKNSCIKGQDTAFDRGNPGHPLIWIACGNGEPSSFLVSWLRKLQLRGARFSSEGYQFPEEEKLAA